MRLSVKEAARRATVSQSLIYALLKTGRLPAVRLGCRGRGVWRIEESDIDSYVESCKVGASSPPPLSHIR